MTMQASNWEMIQPLPVVKIALSQLNKLLASSLQPGMFLHPCSSTTGPKGEDMRAFSHVCSKEEAAPYSAMPSTFCWAGNGARGTKSMWIER